MTDDCLEWFEQTFNPQYNTLKRITNYIHLLDDKTSEIQAETRKWPFFDETSKQP